MANAKSVLLIGLQPKLIDYSSPDYAAFPGMDAAKVQAALDADASRLNGLGYEAQLCLTDFGETAEVVVSEALRKKSFDCVLIGAGVRTVGKNFLLFEKLINVVHKFAPQAKLCFNTKPDDTAEAVKRWV
ncbi:MAG: hypothetical protein ABI478_01960 [Propionivibrio sp.]